ncbi:MAG: NADH-quinone oxidoreductase subunit N [Chloroflexota bacterium]|nr:MAG: NADH-quinone oxidoreductase subunit N [Bellilinea sp.]
MSSDFTPQMWRSIFPEVGLLILAIVLLFFDLIWLKRPQMRARWLGWITSIGIVLIMGVAAGVSMPQGQGSIEWGGMLRFDAAGFVFRMIFMSAAALTALFASQFEAVKKRGEFYALLLISTLGMNLMASAADLILLFLAIETTSIPLYVMAGFLTRDDRSVEAGIKYFLFGAITSAVMLYGFSLIYGLTGTTQIYELSSAFQAGNLPVGLAGLVIVLVLVGFGFKISAVPFHFWAPDVYQGAPTPVAGFLSTASKAAGFAVLLRVFQIVFAGQGSLWMVLIAILATASMLIGNYLALAQRSIKRLLAYSSIAHAGYLLIGIASDSELGTLSVVYYLIAYLVTNLAAFGIVNLIENRVGSDEIGALAGLNRRSAGLALAMLAAMLSLGGIPPFAGFFAKLLVFAAAVERGLIWLVLIGVFNAVVGLYYYLNVLKVIYLHPPIEEKEIVPATPGWRLAMWVCMAGILLVGFWFSPWYSLAQAATSAIWVY